MVAQRVAAPVMMTDVSIPTRRSVMENRTVEIFDELQAETAATNEAQVTVSEGGSASANIAIYDEIQTETMTRRLAETSTMPYSRHRC